jgi:Fe-S oxidoreductase
MSEKNVSLDVTNVNNFVFDMSKCIKCKGCTWVDHTYMPGVKFGTRCPSATKYQWDSYGAYGKMRIGVGLIEGNIDYTDKYLEIMYACTLCGACDAGCKRNLDLEIELSLEALRIKAVKDGKGPMPAHKKIADNIKKTHNTFGRPHEKRNSWMPAGVKPAEKADIVFFAGCTPAYTNPEIAKATVKILKAAGTPFAMMGDEWCCGNVLYSVGMFDEAKALAKRNIEAVKKMGAKTLLTACAECYRTWKVDYPKMLNIATEDLGFKVVHLVEYVDEIVKSGKLKLTKPVNMRATYHDACSLGRLSEPWKPWKGDRELWGCTNPPIDRRRSTNGVYQQPRDILAAIPGLNMVESIRIRENTFCCGAGRGTREAFPDFASFAAEEKLKEVKEVGAEAIISACGRCKNNFNKTESSLDNKVKAYDISEIILASLGQ